VHLGQAAQFTAVATYSDGSTRDVTSEAVWNANPKYLGLVSPGTFLPEANGESHVNASFSGRHANVTGVVIVPAGTYRLTGTVREEGIPLRGVKVVIETETGRLTTSVGDDGAYTVYGVAGRTRVKIETEGYEPAFKDATVTGHERIDFNLVLSRPRRDVSGRYAVTFTTAPECSAFPQEVRVRTYSATLTQNGPRLDFVLDGERFASKNGQTSNRFGGVLGPQDIRVELRLVWDIDFSSYYMVDYPDVLEEFSPGKFYSVEGTGTGPLTSSGMAGTFSGVLGVSTSRAGFFEYEHFCRSDHHRFAATR
jgi:hypothetical protein